MIRYLAIKLTLSEGDSGNANKERNETILALVELANNLKKNGCSVAVENIIEDFLQTDSFEELWLREKLAYFVGEKGAETLLFTLELNDLSIVDDMRKAGISEDLCNFISNLLVRFGERYKSKKMKEYDPFLLVGVRTLTYYVPRTGKIMFGINFHRADGEVLHCETSFEEMFDIIFWVFKEMLFSAKDVLEKLPFTKFEISEGDIKEFIADLKEFEKCVRVQSKL
jgi:hypothetical protein